MYVGHPDALWQSSGCYVCECRVPLLEGVRIGEARYVYSWGNPDEADPDENVCHMSLGDVCHVWGGVPTSMIRARGKYLMQERLVVSPSFLSRRN